MMKAPMLFRGEAVDNQKHLPYGEIRVPRSRGGLLLASLCWGVVCVGVVFAFTAEISRKVTVKGMVVPTEGLAEIAAPISGAVTRLTVSEGQRVSRGDVLATIEEGVRLRSGHHEPHPQFEDRRRALEDVLDSYSRMGVKERERLASQLRSVRSEALRASDELEIAHQRLRLGEEALAKSRALSERGHLAEAAYLTATEVVLERRSAVERAEREVAALSREATELQLLMEDLPDAQRAKSALVEEQLAKLTQEYVVSTAARERVLTAPIDGVVSAMPVTLGTRVAAGQSLLTILPQEGMLQVHLYVPTRAIGFLDSGNMVRLRYDAFPYQKFGHHRGTVLRVSRTTLRADGSGSDTMAGEPNYRVVVGIDEQSVRAYGREEPLLPDMTVEGDIILDRRTLLEWMFEPLLAIGQRLDHDDA